MSLKPPAIPSATYRLQLSGHLTFKAARDLVGYLADLGIGSAYLSPFFRSREGSTHGYDVVDHSLLDPALGSDEDFQAFATELSARGLGLLVDIVPNHMGIEDPHNRWWQDVLENGPASAYAGYFDIDWKPPKESLQGKVLLPVLGAQFGKVLEDGQLHLAYEGQRFVIGYYDRRFPVGPRSSVSILREALVHVADMLEPEVPVRMELESIIAALEHIPPSTEAGPEAIQERHREKEVAGRRLATLLEASPEIRAGLDRALVEFNGRPGEPASFDKLESLLLDQPYRLCYWRVATDEINYRRFFDVDSLAAIRVEVPEVFADVHASIMKMVERGWVTGLRIDHADGLLDPRRYLENLAEATTRALGAGDSVVDQPELRLYTVVEKILAHDEALPSDWLTHGTTGYDYLNILNGVFVDRLGGYAVRDAYARFIGNSQSWTDVLYESKRTILNASLSAELYTLSRTLDRISEQHRFSRDFTRLSLFRALREVVACFPVYRTYIRPDTDLVGDEDRKRIAAAVRFAKRRNPAMSPTFFDFIGSVLLLDDPVGISEEDRLERRRFVLKFQQVTGPVTAKGWEDTGFYRYYPLASLNEVGGDPAMVGTSIEQFHRRLQEQASTWPHTMLATGTHDTKRGEDLRARLNVLSEVPTEWEAALGRWRSLNAGSKTEIEGTAVPDANEAYLIYQTLVGTWPLGPVTAELQAAYVDRVAAYLDKALREAKLHTSWLNPNEEYDQAVAGFIRAVLADWQGPFARDCDGFVRSIADAGFVNSLAQTLVKICSPGVPDFYQGVELWDFNLVDPDNRRPVDFGARRQALSELRAKAERSPALATSDLLAHWPDPKCKLYVIWRALQTRRERIELREGTYEPLALDGPRKAHGCGFARVSESSWTVCVVPRLTSEAWRELGSGTEKIPAADGWGLAPWWTGTVIQLPPAAPARFVHQLSGAVLDAPLGADGTRQLDLATVWRSFPVAILCGEAV